MPPSGRFQSRVFSELSRQRLKWRDRLDRWVRHGRVAATWSAQILLYPIYVGFQALRMASRQLGQARHSAQPRFKALMSALRRVLGQPTTPTLPPSASTPILKTLAAVESLGLQITLPAADRILLLAPPGGAIAPQGTALPVETAVTVRGIASSLESRELILVSTENEVLDVLTSAQQAHLRQCIAAELADYWRDRRQLALAESFQALPLPPPPITDRLLPPVRWFYQLMAWEQRSDVAIAANLFQEATLALYFASHDEALELPPDAFAQEALPGSRALVRSPVSLPVVAAVPGQLQTWGTDEVDTALTVLASDQATAVVPFSPDTTAVATQIETNALQPYIETQAHLVAYEQHPLERLLQWLDRGMLWLEQQVARLWHWWEHWGR